MPAREVPTARSRIATLVALGFSLWVVGLLVAATVSGGPLPDPPAALAAADVTEAAGPAPHSTADQVSPAGEAADTVRVDLVGRSRAPAAVLLRDGRPVARFSASSVVVTVASGDLLEVDGSAYRRALTFVVVDLAPGLGAPAVGTRVQTHGDIVVLGRVAAAARSRTP